MPDRERRFEFATIQAEFEEQYIEGGYHPVYFGDVFNDRYIVFRKLGFATQSTVWLAKDKILNRFVVLKIVKAKYSKIQTLESTFSSDASPNHPGKKHIQEKLDFFTLDGPNGKHSCLVLEPMGRTLEVVLDRAKELLSDADANPAPWDPHKWSTKLGREICRQIVLGLDLLHSQGIMHRDIQPGNLMIAPCYDLTSKGENYIQKQVWDTSIKPDPPTSEPHSEEWSKANFAKQHEYINIIKRLNGAPPEPNDIKYTVGPVHLYDETTLDLWPTNPIRVVLTDLGGACKFVDANEGLIPYPLDVRSPQQILSLPIDEKADIWALGMTLYHIVVRAPLVTAEVSWSKPNQEETDNNQLREMVQRLGAMPDDLRSKWKNADQFTTPDGNLLPVEEEEYGPGSYWYGDIDHAVRVMEPEDMSEDEIKDFVSFIRATLDWDSSKRPTTKELLRHPFLAPAATNAQRVVREFEV